MRETWVRSLGWEDALEKETATHSSILDWRIPRTVLSMGSLRVRLDWATFTFTFCVEAECSFLGVLCSCFWKSQRHWGWLRKVSRSPCPTFSSFSIPTTSASPPNLLVLYIKPLEPQEVSLCTLKAVGVGVVRTKGELLLLPSQNCCTSLPSCPAGADISSSFLLSNNFFFKGMNLCPHVLTSKTQRTHAVFSLGPSYDPPGPEWDCRSCSSTRSNREWAAV